MLSVCREVFEHVCQSFLEKALLNFAFTYKQLCSTINLQPVQSYYQQAGQRLFISVKQLWTSSVHPTTVSKAP